MDKYTIYEGRFSCKTCKIEVLRMRFYKDTGMASWMCKDKHLSEVQICHIGYKKKKDYERKI